VAHVTQLFTSCSYIPCESEHQFGRVVVCSGTVGGTLLVSLQNVQTDALPPAHGHADYTKNVCVCKHDISLFIQSGCQLCWVKMPCANFLKYPKTAQKSCLTCVLAHIFCLYVLGVRWWWVQARLLVMCQTSSQDKAVFDNEKQADQERHAQVVLAAC